MEFGHIVGAVVTMTALIAIVSLIVAPGSTAAAFVSQFLSGYGGIITAAKH